MDPQLKLRGLLGKTLTKIEGATVGSGDVVFETAEGPRFLMTHHQDCCESVSVVRVHPKAVENRLGKVVGVNENIEDVGHTVSESGTKSEFTIVTERGAITIEWLGTSNGYYGEGVDFEEIK